MPSHRKNPNQTQIVIPIDLAMDMWIRRRMVNRNIDTKKECVIDILNKARLKGW